MLEGHFIWISQFGYFSGRPAGGRTAGTLIIELTQLNFNWNFQLELSLAKIHLPWPMFHSFDWGQAEQHFKFSSHMATCSSMLYFYISHVFCGWCFLWLSSIDSLTLFIILPSSAHAQAQLEAELAIILKHPASAHPSNHPVLIPENLPRKLVFGKQAS